MPPTAAPTQTRVEPHRSKSPRVPSRRPTRRNPLYLRWEDYLAYEERSRAKSLGRHEWVNGVGRWENGEELGEVRPVQGYDENGEAAMATWGHNEIVVNLLGILIPLLRGTGMKAASQAMEVRGRNGRGRYPDVLIAPEQRRFERHPEDKALVLLNPLVLIEVLSDTTASTDRGDKLEDYASIPSVTDYLIVAQDEPRVEHRRRTGDGWRLTTHEGLDAAVTLAEPAVALKLAEIYERVFTA